MKQARSAVRPHRGADGQAGAHPARARRRARHHLQRVQGPQGRAHPRHRPALREGQQHHRRPRADRGRAAVPRADAARDVPPRRPHRRLREGHRSRGARSADHPLARRRRTLVEKLFETEVPEIYEGIVRIVGVRARAGRAQQDRRHEPRRGRRSGRRVRRHEGLARAGRRAGAARREDRHRARATAIRRASSATRSSRPR